MVVQMVNNINLGGKLLSGKKENEQERNIPREQKEADKLEEEDVDAKKVMEAEVVVGNLNLTLSDFCQQIPREAPPKIDFRGVPVQPPSYTQHNILGGAKCYIFGPFWANLATKFLKYFLKNTKNAQFNLIQSPNTSNMTKTCESVHKRSKKMQIKSCLYPKN